MFKQGDKVRVAHVPSILVSDNMNTRLWEGEGNRAVFKRLGSTGTIAYAAHTAVDGYWWKVIFNGNPSDFYFFNTDELEAIK